MKFRLLPFVFFLLFASVNAQKISYSEPGGNFDNTQFHIIGSIKNHIIVWEYFHNDYSTSKIVVYDNDMKLINKITFGSIHGRFAILDFLNQKDSFTVISQYVSNHTFFCKRLSFDENGNNTGNETLKSYEVPAGVFVWRDYSVIQSPDKKNFILLNNRRDEIPSKARLSYILFANNKYRFEHSIALPYDSTTSYRFSLDNANHLIVVAGEGKENNKLVLYEINPGTGDFAGIQGAIPEGVLNMESLNISNVYDRVFITAYWKNEQHGVFVWQPDLYNFSAGKDTIYTVQTDSAFDSVKYAFLRTEVYPYRNTYNFFITVNRGSESYPYRYPDKSSPGYYPVFSNQNTTATSFYSGRPTSLDMNSSTTINGVGTMYAYNDGEAAFDPNKIAWQQGYPSGNMPVGNIPIGGIAASYEQLLVYNVDESQNLRWYKYLNDTSDTEFTSFIDPSYNIQTNQLYLLNSKVGNRKEMLNLITINNKGEQSEKPVILMISYKYIFAGGRKISENAVLYPCRKSNRLAFMKVELR